MPTFIVLGKLTAKAKGNLKDAWGRTQALWDEYRTKGLKFTAYSTMGPYDSVVVVEAPSDDAAMKFLFAAGQLGNVDSTTMRAFSADELTKLLAG